jgi:nucleoside-diphosphate-sugar epimerase
MQVLVTGGLGVVGRPLVERLVRNGHSVTVVDRLPEGAIEGASYRSCDINDYASFKDVASDHEAMIHLAAIPFPAGAPGDEIFRVNASGTFNVYAAAAANGIRRVVSASSINYLGFYYGNKDFPIRYFPIDEEHPNYTTDAYSFSKQITEEIGDYFWRRDGITSICLRLPGVFALTPERQAMMKTFLERTQNTIREIEAMSEAEQQRYYQKAMETWESIRQKRVLQQPRETWQDLGYDMQDPIVRFVSSRANFWAFIHAEDSAQAFEKAMLADVQGSHALFVNDDQNTTLLESEKLVRLFFPEVKKRKRPLQGSEALVNIDQARQLIGFEPEFSIRRLVEELN